MIGHVPPAESLGMMLRALKLPAFVRLEEIAHKAQSEGWSFSQ